ncbi:MAG TPA: SDR family oxidoreductase [Spirochaetia bacterium]|nr:SDR family oxidoreductase [Spirochaetia bacterium]
MMNIDPAKLFDLAGKRAAITGAGGALCGTLAEGLAALGVQVALLDLNLEAARHREQVINTAASRADAYGSASAFACDVLDEESLERCYQDICNRWGGVDLLINGAGGNNPAGSTDVEFLEVGGLDEESRRNFFNLSASGFRSTFDLNFFGTFLSTKILARGMAERGMGSILNISSMSALSPLTKVGAYSAAKAAVANFTKWLAVHLSHTGVRVNAIAPGFFMTEQLRFLHIDETTGEYTPRAKKVVAHTPMGRYGEAEDLLGTVIWLLSDASKFVTGNVVPIDGGFSSFSI